MLSYEEALAAVQREIARLTPLPDGDEWIVLGRHSIERPFGWVFCYGSRLHAETGEPRYAVAGNAPFIVNRHTGAVETTGTTLPTEHYIAEHESRLLQPRV